MSRGWSGTGNQGAGHGPLARVAQWPDALCRFSNSWFGTSIELCLMNDQPLSSAETVYFNQSCEEARQAVAEVLDAYNNLLSKLSPEERSKLQR